MSILCRVLFVHGLESGPLGAKVHTLEQCEALHVCAPHMRNTRNVWASFATIVRETRRFRPHVIVASSYGTILTLLLLQFGVWRGPTLLLATAMGVAAPHRLFVPRSVAPLVTFVHGSRDSVCDIAAVRAAAARDGVEFVELDAAHGLACLNRVAPGTKSPAPLVAMTLQRARTAAGENRDLVDDSAPMAWLQLRLTGVVFLAVLELVWRLTVGRLKIF